MEFVKLQRRLSAALEALRKTRDPIERLEAIVRMRRLLKRSDDWLRMSHQELEAIRKKLKRLK